MKTFGNLSKLDQNFFFYQPHWTGLFLRFSFRKEAFFFYFLFKISTNRLIFIWQLKHGIEGKNDLAITDKTSDNLTVDCEMFIQIGSIICMMC